MKKNTAMDHLNVNSVRNKMTEEKEFITNKTDIYLISETKLNQSFPNQQFQIYGYKTFRMDRDKYGGGILFYVNENIPSKVLRLNSTPNDNEVIALEFSIKNLKWLCVSFYKAPSQNDKYFLDNPSKNLGELTCQYDKTIEMEVATIEIEIKTMPCVESVQMRSFFWSEYGKIRTRKNFVFGHFSRSGGDFNLTTDNKNLEILMNTSTNPFPT